MSATSAPNRSSAAARRTGYVVAVLVNAALLYAINIWPGWEAVPFLTDDTRLVLGWVNASIVVGIAANLVYLVRDTSWLKSLGDVLTTAVGLVALLRIWQVFPFDFGDSSFDWPLVVRILLGLGIVGSIIGILVALFSAVRRR
ncbi:hypothetical protein ACWDTG_16305 [Rhodococcus zopfii]|uniref:hypothetical protein n=1 Tax=Rhodococcus zopfii TaxID=43772 RepID=UPI0011111C93|nr:hypothetical protein [Rhodococcus zopfii]